ncbi:MAG: UDP-N-acetylmuramoyl-tripeptide-D-alanyl-D-alanine ligase [Candidatus Levybacteria bacterium GW2011_GWA2_40_8]|nr:MAG: UDP-N-acetylmuramoyl-tripeptide-D-alanyl-D-alanine ligase [Candidatus Levybacteria bacterium GW2011_GWA2_40_8]
MISKIFPFRLHLQILQLGEYRIVNFLKWIAKNLLKRSTENKKKLVFSAKAKLVLVLALTLFLLTVSALTFIFGITGLVLGVILGTQPYLFLAISTFLLKLPENIARTWIKQKTAKKVASYKNLKVIGITGSYGKTSVKEFLYQILKTQFKTLKTPKSYNTVLGISKVVDLELDETYEYFICELAAYKRGEVRELCEMLSPSYGILTGINEQHLEMFGSIQNTTKAKFELIEAISENGFALVNVDNEIVPKSYKKYKKNLIPYGFSGKKFSAKNIKSVNNGTQFELILDGKKLQAKTKLIGKSQIQNIIAAASIAFKLGVSPAKIISAIEELMPVPHRLDIKKINGFQVIDDAYNSNVTGFSEALNLLGEFKSSTKVIVTPGIVDLGSETRSIHSRLGKLCDQVCDYVILVGKSDRTDGLGSGISNKRKVIYIDSVFDIWERLRELNLKDPIILIENDLPDNY